MSGTLVSWSLGTLPEPPPGAASDEELSAVQKAKRSMLLRYAEGDYLTQVGQNYGIPRPPSAASDDELYRRIVQVLAWQPKGTTWCVYHLMAAIFGSQAEIVANGQRPWRVYEFTNEIVVELPHGLVSGNTEISSYLHGFASYVRSGATTTVLTCRGNAEEAASSLFGLSVSTLVGGAWETRLLSGCLYDEDTDISTITTAAFSAPPDDGAQVFITVPGDNTTSHRGDYMASPGFTAAFSTAAGPPTPTLSVVGNITQYVAEQQTITLNYGATTITRVVSARSYNSTTNVTTVTVTVDVDGGVSGLASMASENADGATTPPHSDRFYLSGDKMEIFHFYNRLGLVRAAGVVLRVEYI